MKTEFTPNICYMAGLLSKSHAKEKNFVGIDTEMEELQQRFVEIAVNDLKIEPNKILLAAKSAMSVGFYHSRVAKQLQDIVKREVHVFKIKNDLARNYIAGMFDISGHLTGGVFEIRHVNASDALILERLGVHTRGDRILNMTEFIKLIKGHSLLLEQIRQQGKKAGLIIDA